MKFFWEMIEGLEGRYKVEEGSFETIFGSLQGHRIFASRKVAERKKSYSFQEKWKTNQAQND